jgi:hypothetical protein
MGFGLKLTSCLLKDSWQLATLYQMLAETCTGIIKPKQVLRESGACQRTYEEVNGKN